MIKPAQTLWLIATLVFFAAEVLAAKRADKVSFYSSADVGIGNVDEDLFFLLYLEQGFAYKGLDLQLSGPLRFRISDKPPRDSRGLRSQDWDEASDFARILQSATFNHSWSDGYIDLKFGELNGVGLGHGCVVDAYFNSTDMDHYQGGLVSDVNFMSNGIEFMLENVVEPEIFVGRAYIAPLAWFLDGDWPSRLEFGYTLGVDSTAPRRVISTDETQIWITGGDVSLRLVDTSIVTITPYADLLVMDGDLGFHGGLASTWFFSDSRDILFHLRGEYRALGSDYHPALLNPFYEYNRYFFGYDSVAARKTTLADHLSLEEPPVAHGFMVDATLDWRERVRLGARYDYQGDHRPHWIMLRLDVAPVDRFSFGAFYAGQDIEGGLELFSSNALIGASASVEIAGPLRSFIEFSRRWRRVQNNMNFKNENGIGAGLLFVY